MSSDILIFADLTDKIGTGHFWRCARLASTLVQEGRKVTFLTPKNERARALIEIFASQNDHGTITFNLVPGISNHKKDERIIAPLPDAVIKQFPGNFNLTIADSHRLSPAHLRHMKQSTGCLCLIDDIMHRHLTTADVDLVINPTLPSGFSDYGNIRTLCPPDAHLLPPSFFQNYERDPDNVFIAFSGVDFGQISISALQIMKALDPDMGNKDLRFTLAVNNMGQIYNSCALDLSKHLNGRFTTVSAYNAPEMLGKAGMIVCAAGQISFEASAAGTPMAGITHISKPTELLSQYFRNQGIPYGDLYGIIKGEDVSPKLLSFVETLLDVFSNRSAVTAARPDQNGLQKVITALQETRSLRPKSIAGTSTHL